MSTFSLTLTRVLRPMPLRPVFWMALLWGAFEGLAPHAASAQGKMNFTNEKHDFGQIMEGRLASHEFEFVNTGSTPVVIANVNASCGCTTPFWTKEPIAPGQKGFIRASYNSAGRPGPFAKTITVVSNSDVPTRILTISGTVLNKGEKPAITDEMKQNSAKLVLDRATVNLGKLEVGQAGIARFTIRNTGKSDLDIYDVSSVNRIVTWRMDKSKVAPGDQATLQVTLTPRSEGTQEEQLTISSTDYNNFFSQAAIKCTVVPAGSSSGVMGQRRAF